MNILQKCWPTAYRPFLMKVVQAAAKHDEPELVQEFNWHELRDQRCKHLERGISEARTCEITILMVVYEPLRYLCFWFLRRGSSYRRTRRQQQGKVPPLCDLVWLEGSPTTRVLQYYSWLLSGKGRRMRLVWGRAYASFEEWSKREPEQLLLFRTACPVGAPWVF